MFGTKDLAAIKEQLRQIEAKHDATITQITALKTSHDSALQTLTQQLKELHEKHFTYFDEYERTLTAFRDLNLKYQKSFDDLHLFKNDLAAKALVKIEKDLKDEVDKHLGSLANDTQQIHELRTNIEQAKTEIQRLMLLSHHVKDADFQITQTLQKLSDAQNEKNKLLGHVDSLQNLIAKMRQGRHS